MPTHADFLAAVIADPTSDGPRLIYADWLEESGDDARAEFIRVQCALARACDRDGQTRALAERESQLLSRHQADWRQPLDLALFPDGEVEPLGVVRTITEMAGAVLSFGRFDWAAEFVRRLLMQRWQFRRGFGEILCTTLPAYRGAAERIHRVTPLRSLRVSVDGDVGAGALADCEQLADLTSLRLFGRGAPLRELARLVESPHLGQLTKLAIADLSLGDFEVEELARSELFARLRELVISGTGTRYTALRALVESRALPGFERLALRSFGSDIPWLAVLIAWPECPALEDLDLSGNALCLAELSHLLDRLPALRNLSLRDAGLTDFGLRSILRSPRLRQLKRLDLSGNIISDAGAMDLADAPNLLAPTQVVLTGNTISERILEVLRIRLGDQVTL